MGNLFQSQQAREQEQRSIAERQLLERREAEEQRLRYQRRYQQQREAEEVRQQQQVARLQQQREAEEARQQQQREAEIVRQQQRQEAERVRQQQQREAERVRRQQRRVERENAKFYRALSDASDIIDHFIRTRNKFNTSNPLQYSCQFQTIENECGENIEELLAAEDVPHIDNRRYLPLTVRTVVDYYSDSNSPRCRFSIFGSCIKVTRLTPLWDISSTHRVYGIFQCFLCDRSWESAASWKDKWQKCKGCEARTYPHVQHVLEVGGGAEEQGKRPHDMKRCQKCRELGRICVPSMYYSA